MSERRKRTAASGSVSAHPAFPAIVALWFAALLGIGSLVLPVALLERISQATGLPAYLALAQPPLGVTARIAIALVAATAGFLAGLAIARRIAVAHREMPVRGRVAAVSADPRASATTIKRPISAHEELGDSDLDAGSPPSPAREGFAGRRRPLSVTDDSARSEFFDNAPLPGHDPDENAPLHAPHEPIAAELCGEETQASAEPLDLGEFDTSGEEEPASAWDLEPGRESPVRFESAAFQSFGTGALSAPPPTTPMPEADLTAQEPTEMTRHTVPGPADHAQTATATGEVAIVDLVGRFARALQRHREDAAAEAERAASGAAMAESGDDDAILDLTAALSPRQAPGADVATRDAVPAAMSADALAGNGPDNRLEAAPAVPKALRPLYFDCDDWADDEEDDDEVVLPDLSLSLAQGERPFSRPAAAAVADSAARADATESSEADDDESAGEDASGRNYSSLLAMKSPFGIQREPVRVEDDEPTGDAGEEEEEAIEPIVVFPGQAHRPAPPTATGPRPFDAPGVRAEAATRGPATAPGRAAPTDETERALRDALEKLQRMSGTA
ncbi:hypothetical protein N0B51_01855 [Tsuneonella sp. YG55]|uniref:Uncharacterized protein n=1 Tax=Tsuneonella litorea TaxID=2976475 RepID=A0A9X3AKE2_9SPHN|nr:hypothetical protein [Tsuneonella litorea]MCT2557718.1 hypothetical protein [Tsuneonella litorea]